MPEALATFSRIVGTAIGLTIFLPCLTPAPAPAAPTMNINCQIRVTANKEAVRIEAIARTHQPASGHYKFRVFKESPSGSSQNAQSGAFSLEADRESILTIIVLDGSAMGHYQAKLILDSDLGSTSCVSP